MSPNIKRPRAYTLSGKIKISRADMKLFEAGQKRCTIRLGNASVESDNMVLTDGRKHISIRITRVVNGCLFGELNEAHASAEGFSSVAELTADLRQYYPNLTDRDPMTVIYFEPSEVPLRLF